MKKESYIGVTGITNIRHAELLLQGFPQTSNRLLMIGVLAGSKLLRGERNKYWRQFPKSMETIGEIFPNHPKALNLIHFHNDDEDRFLLADQMMALANIKNSGRNMHGFQINIAWPKPIVFSTYLQAYPDKSRIVLQIGKNAMSQIGQSPTELVNRLKDYTGTISDILIDPSGGFGKSFDPQFAQDLLIAVTENFPNLGIGVAGGLGPDQLDGLKTLVKQVPYLESKLNIDAQGRLRDGQDFGGELVLKTANQYILQATEILG